MFKVLKISTSLRVSSYCSKSIDNNPCGSYLNILFKNGVHTSSFVQSDG